MHFPRDRMLTLRVGQIQIWTHSTSNKIQTKNHLTVLSFPILKVSRTYWFFSQLMHKVKPHIRSSSFAGVCNTWPHMGLIINQKHTYPGYTKIDWSIVFAHSSNILMLNLTFVYLCRHIINKWTKKPNKKTVGLNVRWTAALFSVTGHTLCQSPSVLLAKCPREWCFCSAQGPPSIVNKKNSFNISCLSHLQVIEFDDGSGSVLRIQPLRTPRDEAIYECVASNSVGETSATTRLTVLRGRSFSTNRKNKKNQTINMSLSSQLLQLTQVSQHLLVLCLSCPLFLFVSDSCTSQSNLIRDTGCTHVVYAKLIRFTPLTIKPNKFPFLSDLSHLHTDSWHNN